MENELITLEEACETLGKQCSTKVLQEAEQIILHLRTPSKEMMNFILYAIKNTKYESVLFQCIIALRTICFKIWNLLENELHSQIIEDLFEYLTSNLQTLTNEVINQLIYLLALITKRNFLYNFELTVTLDNNNNLNTQNQENFFQLDKELENQVTGLLEKTLFPKVIELCQQKSIESQLIGLKFLKNLIEEFSLRSNSTLGISLENHVEIKAIFQKLILPSLFDFIFEILNNYLPTINSLLEKQLSHELSILILLLNILSLFITWEFSGDYKKLREQLVIIRQEGGSLGSSIFDGQLQNERSFVNLKSKGRITELDGKWAYKLFENHLLDLLFKIFNTDLKKYSHDVKPQSCLITIVRCITHLATVSSKLLTNEYEAFQLLENILLWIQSITSLNSFNDLFSFENQNIILQFCLLIQQLGERFRFTKFIKLKEPKLKFELISNLTLQIVNNNGLHKISLKSNENPLIYLFDFWSSFVSHAIYYSSSNQQEQIVFLSNYVSKIYQKVIENTLNQFQDFNNNSNQNQNQKQENYNDDDDEDEDQDQEIKNYFNECLETFTNLGRASISESINFWITILDNIHEKFAEHLSNENIPNYNFNETLYWTITLIGYLLADNTESSEDNLIPESISLLGYEDEIIIELFQLMFKLLELQNSSINIFGIEQISPLIVSRFSWFLERWSLTYLFVNFENYYQYQSCGSKTRELNQVDNLIEKYSKETQQSLEALEFILKQIVQNIINFIHEPKVMESNLQLFSNISNTRKFSKYLIQLDALQELLNNHNSSDLSMIPSGYYKKLLEIFCKIIGNGYSKKDKSNVQKQFLKIIEPIMNNLLSLFDYDQNTNNNNNEEENEVLTQSNYQNTKMIEKVVFSLECINGIIRGSVRKNIREYCFEFCLNIFDKILEIVQLYKNYNQITRLVLVIFTDFTKRQISFLKNENLEHYIEVLSKLFTFFIKTNKQILFTQNEKEKKQEDYKNILLLLQLLINLISANFGDFENDNVFEAEMVIRGTETSKKITVSVLLALGLILDLITEDLISHPKFATRYYRLIHLLFQTFPQNLLALECDLFDSLLNSLKYGIENTNSEIAKFCLESINSIADYAVKNDNPLIEENKLFDKQKFFKWNEIKLFVYQIIIENRYSSDLIPILSNCLFSLICSNHNYFKQLNLQLLNNQNGEEQKNKLHTAINNLLNTEQFDFVITRKNKSIFRKRFDLFLQTVTLFLNKI
ncbi:exportin-4 [Anaeramoeba flamelloides]|uniref:Exportin-4 n=1 Tax=Anaeramoeba flamelloides TaxID=1746091 RepID=A0AAV8A1Q5_9EUKA|nr:exportin-4 [Anaeramoeba flamelloides]